METAAVFNPIAPLSPRSSEQLDVPVRPHLILVDDDEAIRHLARDYLVQNDLRVSAVASGREMQAVLNESAVDLILLDLHLGDEDGMHIAKQLRDESTVPIIILTGRQHEADRVMGLELGADDYVTKPFSPRELLARVRALLRRSKVSSEMQAVRDERRRAYRFLGWELNLGTRRLISPVGELIHLSNGEFSLLQAFCSAPLRVLTREQLLGLSRLHGAEVYDRSVDVQILRLRRKIEPDASEPRVIVTERGVGYRFATRVDVVR